MKTIEQIENDTPLGIKGVEFLLKRTTKIERIKRMKEEVELEYWKLRDLQNDYSTKQRQLEEYEQDHEWKKTLHGSTTIKNIRKRMKLMENEFNQLLYFYKKHKNEVEQLEEKLNK